MEDLAELGIRYFIGRQNTPEEKLSFKFGWKEIDRRERLVLFENPLKPTPFYYGSKSEGFHFVRPEAVEGNSLKIYKKKGTFKYITRR